MVAPSHATARSVPLILLSLMEASTIDDTSSCVDPGQAKNTDHNTAACSENGTFIRQEVVHERVTMPILQARNIHCSASQTQCSRQVLSRWSVGAS